MVTFCSRGQKIYLNSPRFLLTAGLVTTKFVSQDSVSELETLERLIGTIRRECLDQLLFWTATDLKAKLLAFKNLLQRISGVRSHRQQGGHQLDAVPQVLQAQVFVIAVLVVVVIPNGDADLGYAQNACGDIGARATCSFGKRA
jgi:hypothetical protein